MLREKKVSLLFLLGKFSVFFFQDSLQLYHPNFELYNLTALSNQWWRWYLALLCCQNKVACNSLPNMRKKCRHDLKILSLHKIYKKNIYFRVPTTMYIIMGENNNVKNYFKFYYWVKNTTRRVSSRLFYKKNITRKWIKGRIYIYIYIET
jgi:hypothetical protein